MEMKQHPLSAAFPAMSAADFAALVDDIKAHGQREPVIVFEGMVLDGWHRYTACLQLGIKPQQFTFSDGKDPVAFVLSQNLHRRHLSASQRAAAVVACSDWHPAGRPKKVEAASTPPLRENIEATSTPSEKKVEAASTPLTNAELAKAAGVTPRTITDAKAAHKAGLTEAVKEGALTVEEAARVARGKKPVAKTAKRTLDQPQHADTNGDALQEANHTIAELAEENEKLRDKIAVESMDTSESAKTEAAETIRELRAKVKTLEAELSAVKASRDTFMRNEGELKKQITYWRKKAEKVSA